MTTDSAAPDADQPEPLATLRARTFDALDELTEFDSDDPAAASALRAVRLARHTLEWFWLPAIDDRMAALGRHEHHDRG